MNHPSDNLPIADIEGSLIEDGLIKGALFEGSLIKSALIEGTVRLQFNKDFTFDDAINYVDYFAALGITHLYSSPILTSRHDSTHGYDIVDPTQINAQLGGEDGLRRLVAALRAAGMGLIVDIVPNHLGVGGHENPWWQHVFEWGPASPYASWFDIDWQPADPQLDHKILAPFLGDPYGEVLDKGEIVLSFDRVAGRFFVKYFSHHFPVAPAGYASILRRAQAMELSPGLVSVIAELDGLDMNQPFPVIEKSIQHVVYALRDIAAEEKGKNAVDICLDFYNAPTPAGRQALHELLENQHYRLTWWRNAADEINWRRFFEISELAGIRVELDEVFEAMHALVFRLFEQGLIDGLRLDHIDGLAQPKEYCLKLRARLETLVAKRPPSLQQRPYIVAEKILAFDEMLRPDWLLDGTTGYEFMDQVSAVLHDPRGTEPLSTVWKELAKDPYDFPQHIENSRRQLLSENLVGELSATAAALHSLARADVHTRDYSLAAIKRVLIEILVHFPVYRTYVSVNIPSDISNAAPDEKDLQVLEATWNKAKRTLSQVDKPLLDIVLGWLSGELILKMPDSEVAKLSRRAITRFQQLTPPLLAKSVEDTSFYRYGRLLSRNEVGSDPAVLSITVDEFHRQCIERQANYPQTLLATATHDHKRGEDARARIAVLSQIPQRWSEVVAQWLQINARFHVDIHPSDNLEVTYNAPRAHHELMLYQTIIGSWPYELTLDDTEGLKAFAGRLDAWLLKSIREAKRISNWVQANETYEKACSDFISNIMDMEQSVAFLQSIYLFIQEISATGTINSLAQTLLRNTTPGIPDLYQGAELWDLSMVDPDNRTPVDYDMRRQLLEAGISDVTVDLKDKLLNWQNGALKQYVIQRALHLRKKEANLFCRGQYIPLEVKGAKAVHILAFMRSEGDKAAIVITPRLTHAFTQAGDGREGGSHGLSFTADFWQDTKVELPTKVNGEMFNELTQRNHHLYSGQIEISAVLGDFPLALLFMKGITV